MKVNVKKIYNKFTKYSKYSKYSILGFFNIFLINTSYAIYGEGGGDTQTLGTSARGLSSALFDIANLWLAVSMIAGMGFLFVGIVKYFEHRKNPQQTPLGQVILLLFIAFALIGMYVFVQFGDSLYVQLQDTFD